MLVAGPFISLLLAWVAGEGSETWADDLPGETDRDASLRVPACPNHLLLRGRGGGSFWMARERSRENSTCIAKSFFKQAWNAPLQTWCQLFSLRGQPFLLS